MADPKQFHRWQPDRASLENLSPERARDLVVQCFFEAQRETIARAKVRLGVAATDESIHTSAQGSLRAAFRKTGGDFERPTKESLFAAVQDLVGASASMGTPPDIIEHHRKIIEDALGRL